MSKKTFSAAPKPKQQLTDDQILAFERGGAGHDTTSKPAPAAAEAPKDVPMKRLSIDLPEDAHRRFKSACAATGRKMATELTGFIERRTAELESDTHK